VVLGSLEFVFQSDEQQAPEVRERQREILRLMTPEQLHAVIDYFRYQLERKSWNFENQKKRAIELLEAELASRTL
jgi:hypothetical protein